MLRVTSTLAHVLLLLSLPGFAATVAKPQLPPAALSRPLVFEPNLGQAPAPVSFLARSTRYTALLRPSGFDLLLRPRAGTAPSRLTLRFTGSDPSTAAVATEALPSTSNYILGADPALWRTGVPNFARVTTSALYPGVDATFYGTAQGLEYDFVVAPHASPARIRMRLAGASRLALTRQGDLAIQIASDTLLLQRPVAFQNVAGRRSAVTVAYTRLRDGSIGFRLGPYQHTAPLVIDPRLISSTFLGGTTDEGIFGIGLDRDHNLYVAGETSSVDFPSRRPAQSHLGGSYDAFVSKFDPSGAHLLASTFLGGSGYDHAVALAITPDGSAILAGTTESPDFPLAHPLQPQLHGEADAFVTRLAPSGKSLIFSTFLGGSAYDQATDLALDPQGNILLAGSTQSLDFPVTAGALQPTCGGTPALPVCTGDAFFSKLSPTGSRLLVSTYFGGSGTDSANGLAAGPDGSAYLVGASSSSDLPTSSGALQPAIAGYSNAFITRLSPDGTTFLTSTFLGGNLFDSAQGVALDHAGNIFVTGYTQSSNFPLAHAFQSAFAGQLDGFVSKLNPSASALLFSTYLGGSALDIPFRIAVDAAGNASIVGFTASPDFPLVHSLQPVFAGGVADAFLARFSTTGSRVSFSSLLGGSGDDYGYGLHTTLNGAVWIGGSTSSTNFPTRHAFQPTYAGGPFDAFLSKVFLDPTDAVLVLQATLHNFDLDRRLDHGVAQHLDADLEAVLHALQANHLDDARDRLAAFEADLLHDLLASAIPTQVANDLALAAFEIFEEVPPSAT